MATTVIDLQWFCVHMEYVSQYTCTHQCTEKAAVYFSGPTVTANILAQLGSNPLNLRPMLQQTYHTACKFKNTT